MQRLIILLVLLVGHELVHLLLLLAPLCACVCVVCGLEDTATGAGKKEIMRFGKWARSK